MTNRLWQSGLVWSCLAFAAGPCWAQFGGGGSGFGGGYTGGGSAVDNHGNGMAAYGVPTTIDLKDATLGQVIDLLRETNVKSNDYPEPVSFMISEKLRDLKVGTIMLSELLPKDALEAISHSTEKAFVIEYISEGRVLVLSPPKHEVVVKAIKLSWMDPHQLPNIGTMLTGRNGEQTPEAAENEKKRIAQDTEEMLEAVEVAFAMYAEVSGRSLAQPKITVQERLKMVMVVGTPESVQVATEIINATNSRQFPGGVPGMRGGLPGVMGGGGGYPGAGGGSPPTPNEPN